MLLEDEGIGVLLVADRALVEHAHWRLGAVDSHVRLEVSLGGESASADAALEGALASVGPVVHLQGRLAGEHAVADDALVGVGQLVLDAVDQLLQLGGLAALVYLDEGLPRIVVAARTRKQVGVDVGVLGRVEVGREQDGPVRGGSEDR